MNVIFGKYKVLPLMVIIALLLSFVMPSTVEAMENQVEVVLFNDSNGNGQIEADELLYSPHKLQVSGSGDYTTGQTFTLPTDIQLKGRLHSGSIYGPWQKLDPANDCGHDPDKLELEFATVHVFLYNEDGGDGTYDPGCTNGDCPPDPGCTNGDCPPDPGCTNGDCPVDEVDMLGAPHMVRVSGSGDYTTGQNFHVPPDTQIRYRLRSGDIYGPWQKQVFPAGDTDWELEFATVHVIIDQPDTTVQVSGSGDYANGQTFHVPPDKLVRYRLHTSSGYNAWQTQSFPAGDTDWVLP